MTRPGARAATMPPEKEGSVDDPSCAHAVRGPCRAGRDMQGPSLVAFLTRG
jgi:hypothetical protein